MKRKAKPARKSSERDVDAFLASMRGTAIRGICTACGHPERKAIEAACHRFLKLRKAGKTALPFHTFVRTFVVPKFGLTLRGDGISNHMEKCCGTKVA